MAEIIKFNAKKNKTQNENNSDESQYFQPVRNWLDDLYDWQKAHSKFVLATNINPSELGNQERQVFERIKGILAEASYEIRKLTNNKHVINIKPRFFQIANADIWVAENISAITKSPEVPTLIKREIRKGNYDEVSADMLLTYKVNGVEHEITIEEYAKSKPRAWQCFPYCVVETDDLFDE